MDSLDREPTAAHIRANARMLGRYRVLEPLGRGGMGEIYLAEDPALGRRVAIKVVAFEQQGDPDRRSRLLYMPQAASALNHPSIVVIHDMGESNGSLFAGFTGRWATPGRRPSAAPK